jgi:recombinational DNA repair ATPase RecF
VIQIEAVTIREIRGIRDLTIEPEGKNFVISGPNGSGKSGVVDAIQFALTGEMSRLSGKGTGGLSVARHGPHVDRRDDPASAEVSLRLRLPDKNKSIVLTRNIKTAKKFRLEPNDAEIRAVIEEVASHPELSLSRREIIKFIIVEAGERSKEIQALLKLDEIGQTRGVLKTASNKLAAAARQAKSAAENAEDALRRHLDIKSLEKEEILAAVNPHRRTLALTEISELKPATDLSAGVLEGGTHTAFNKETALRDVEALEQAGRELATLANEEAARVLADLTTLDGDPALREAITRRSFIQRGLTLVEGTQCPLCDAEWDDEEVLKAHLRAKLAKADEAEAVQTRLQEDASAVSREARRIASLVKAVYPLAKTDGPDGFVEELEAWFSDLESFAGELGSIETLDAQRERLKKGWSMAPASLKEQTENLKQAIQARTDQSASVAAQTSLTLAQDRLKALQSALRQAKRSATAAEAGRTVYNSYCESADAYLIALYEAVEDEFGAYYREINAEDEGEFKAKLEPEEGGLDLEVAFYDKGMYPPGAYHSEGHQDGMGVCLYLALMNRMFGDRFRFAVLDDVVMSVDQGHRKEFCRLLKTRFPETQFIITTHDRVWAKQMQNEGLVDSKGGVAFHSWSVQTGPIVEQADEVWDQIVSDVAKGDVDVAASRLRRHMEFMAGELADGLAARPPFRADFSYDLGDLLPAVIGCYGQLLSKAAKAANTWDDAEAKTRIAARKEAWSEAIMRYGDENWVVNKAIHFNEWASFTKNEFREVVEAFRGVLAQLRCSKDGCESWLYVTPKKGEADALRCRCDSMSLNLRAK